MEKLGDSLDSNWSTFGRRKAKRAAMLDVEKMVSWALTKRLQVYRLRVWIPLSGADTEKSSKIRVLYVPLSVKQTKVHKG